MNHLPLSPLADADVARFDCIAPEGIVPQIREAIDTHRHAVEAICKGNDRDFSAVLLAKEAADLALNHVWNPISHLTGVANSPELRAAHGEAEEMLAEHGLWVSQNRGLYDAVAAIRWDKEADAPARRLQELALRGFELSGVALEGEARERYRAISTELTQLTTAFGNAVLDATDGFHIDVRRKETLEGIPESHLARFRVAAKAAGVRGWRIGLQGPDVQAVLTYARSRSLRRRLYAANATRASDQGPQAGQFDNSARIERILALRHEAASLLGFPTIADRSLATKMAPDPDTVETFLCDLSRPARAAARRDMAEIAELGRAEFGIARVRPWDVGFLSEILRQRRYSFDAEAVRAYFPADTVTTGVMAMIGRLFGIRFVRRTDVPVWHPDAHFHDVVRPDGRVIAGVYLDLFARAGKRGGAWMDVCRERFVGPDGRHLPVAFLTCNFAGGGAGTVATLRHDDVVTFLHEFGHVLHHILTEVDYPSIGGIHAVEWDAVELPSQLMENFAWDYDALSLFSGHVETGEKLPRALFDRMAAARNFQSGMRLSRQLEFALFDLRLHRDYDPAQGARVMETLNQVRREVAVLRAPDWNRFPHGFTHIFSGGYSAGYYSYLWAELLSADAFGRFRAAGGVDPETGAAFQREVLARGATRPTAENFAAFRGRAPEPDALLESYGLMD